MLGLTLYSLGAVFFWPTAHFSSPGNEKASFGGFLVCTLVIACGLATLETSANSYAVGMYTKGRFLSSLALTP